MTQQTEKDVVVLGGGGAGLAAAIEAARFGRDVVLIEKNANLGGSTSWSVGSISATNTPHQRRSGIQDSPDEHFEDLELLAGPLANRDNRALRRILVDHTTEMMDWLMDMGLVFAGPRPEPPHRYARMHNVLPNSGSFAYHLARRARALGVDLHLGTRAERLVEENGRVVGVETRRGDGSAHHFRARGAVVLASGDYSGSRGLKAKLASNEVAGVEAVNATSTGDGHLLGMELGARVVNGDIVRGPIMRFVPPGKRNLLQRLPPWKALAQLMAWSVDHLPDVILRPFMMSFLTTALGPSPELFKKGAIFVNKAGERFTDELAKPAYDLTRQPEKLGFITFDAALAEKFSAWPDFISTAPGVAYAYLDDYRRNRKDIFHTAGSVEGLAKSIGAPPAALIGTIDGYNAEATTKGLPALARPPYYALGPVKSYVVFTDGGLDVTERLEVKREKGKVIPGLYAAGSVGQGGLLLEGHGHHLGWAFISGRIAGRNAALEVRGSAL